MAEGQYDNPLYVECANFAPPLTGEEMCHALGPVANHVLAVMPKGRDTWEVHVTTEEIRDSLEVKGLTLRGRHYEVSRRFPRGTWVRIRGLPLNERERKMFYLTTHSTHFIYGYMASDLWLRTILIVRKETRCRHIGYSYRLTARVLLYAPSHRQDNTYHGLCYTSRGR